MWACQRARRERWRRPQRHHRFEQFVHQAAAVLEWRCEQLVFDGPVTQPERDASTDRRRWCRPVRCPRRVAPDATTVPARSRRWPRRVRCEPERPAAVMIGSQLQPCPLWWCSSMLTALTPRVSDHDPSSTAALIRSLRAAGSSCGAAKLNRRIAIVIGRPEGRRPGRRRRCGPRSRCGHLRATGNRRTSTGFRRRRCDTSPTRIPALAARRPSRRNRR